MRLSEKERGGSMSFSEKVSRLLKENGMTKAALAKESGIPYTTLDSMLKRDTDTSRLEGIFRMAKALGTSVEALVFDQSEEESISPEEKRILELYSLLDSRGKNTVLSLLESQAPYGKGGSVIPVYTAPAAAGEPLPVLSDEAEEVSYLQGEIPKGANFGIPISGDSMEPLLKDGDVVYVERVPSLSSGQIGIFLLNGESLCKQYVVKEGNVFLTSLNPKYDPIPILESDDLRLVGKVMVE